MNIRLDQLEDVACVIVGIAATSMFVATAALVVAVVARVMWVIFL